MKTVTSRTTLFSLIFLFLIHCPAGFAEADKSVRNPQTPSGIPPETAPLASGPLKTAGDENGEFDSRPGTIAQQTPLADAQTADPADPSPAEALLGEFVDQATKYYEIVYNSVVGVIVALGSIVVLVGFNRYLRGSQKLVLLLTGTFLISAGILAL